MTVAKMPVRIWSTDGEFLPPSTAKKNYLKVAAANWHALATYCGRLLPRGHALLVDMGTTTTDIIMLEDGAPIPKGKTDHERLDSLELWYAGWKRTPAAAFCPPEAAREHFATIYDACIVSKLIPEDPNDYDTADGRSATMNNCKARLARLKCSDIETLRAREINEIAYWITYSLMYQLKSRIRMAFEFTHNTIKGKMPILISGSGTFLVQASLRRQGQYFSKIKLPLTRKILLSDRVGDNLSVAAPAYAVAVLAAERRP
jgi:probable H4MPT-linked C1 transfer pathway protein